jgi:hypothetical protein
MSISYSGIVNYGKATLPSVESWGSNNNILRDPPRSITTRRIDKVTDSSMLDEEIDKSSDRVAESIRVYPRGSNVMVGVSYNNQGFNAGGQQAKLPYRVMRDGVFRPPILRPVNLYPLSRMPRNNTTVDPIAYTVDFQKKLVCPGTAKDYRSVKDAVIHYETQPTKSQPIRTPTEVGVTQNIVGDRLHVDAQTTKVQNIDYPSEVGVRQNIQTPLVAEAYSKIKYFDHAPHAQSKKYTKDAVHMSTLQYNVRSNTSQNRFVQPVQGKIMYRPNPRVHGTATANIKGTATKYVHHNVQEMRQKPILRGDIHVNASGAGTFNRNTIRPTRTHVNLPQKPQLGSQMTNPAIPTFDRAWDDSNKKLKGNTFNHLMKKSNA